MGYLEMLLNFEIFGDFPYVCLFLISNLVSLRSDNNVLCMILSFKFDFFMVQSVVVLVNIP